MPLNRTQSFTERFYSFNEYDAIHCVKRLLPSLFTRPCSPTLAFFVFMMSGHTNSRTQTCFSHSFIYVVVFCADHYSFSELNSVHHQVLKAVSDWGLSCSGRKSNAVFKRIKVGVLASVSVGKIRKEKICCIPAGTQ